MTRPLNLIIARSQGNTNRLTAQNLKPLDAPPKQQYSTWKESQLQNHEKVSLGIRTNRQSSSSLNAADKEKIDAFNRDADQS